MVSANGDPSPALSNQERLKEIERIQCLNQSKLEMLRRKKGMVTGGNYQGPGGYVTFSPPELDEPQPSRSASKTFDDRSQDKRSKRPFGLPEESTGASLLEDLLPRGSLELSQARNHAELKEFTLQEIQNEVEHGMELQQSAGRNSSLALDGKYFQLGHGLLDPPDRSVQPKHKFDQMKQEDSEPARHGEELDADQFLSRFAREYQKSQKSRSNSRSNNSSLRSFPRLQDQPLQKQAKNQPNSQVVTEVPHSSAFISIQNQNYAARLPTQ